MWSRLLLFLKNSKFGDLFSVMKFILAKKLEMTQKFLPDGRVIPATRVLAGPCKVVEIINRQSAGYLAVKLGFGQKKKLPRALAGQLKGLGNLAKLKEFRLKQTQGKEVLPALVRGDEVTAEIFFVGDQVQVTGWAKGRGFQGVVKRHHFKGGPRTHGHKDNARMPGAIGAGGVQHVRKGTRMGGRMGNQKVTTKGLEILEVNPEANTLLISGTIPGARNGLLMIRGAGELIIKKQAVELAATETVKTEGPASN